MFKAVLLYNDEKNADLIGVGSFIRPEQNETDNKLNGVSLTAHTLKELYAMCAEIGGKFRICELIGEQWKVLEYRSFATIYRVFYNMNKDDDYYINNSENAFVLLYNENDVLDYLNNDYIVLKYANNLFIEIMKAK